MMKYALIAAGFLLAGCTSQWDMQGVDPKDYYGEHPIKNTLETRNASVVAHFMPKESRLTADEIDNLQTALHNVSPAAAESVTLWLANADMKNEPRKESIARSLHIMGYDKNKIMFKPSAVLARGDVEIDIAYAAVIAPDCPDWRTSPVTTYSNTTQGNFKCAQEVNLGLMVADPHDLVRGSGDVEIDTEKASRAIQDYHSVASVNAPKGATDAAAAANAAAAAVTSGTSPQ